jgi:putative endonuclease
MDARQRRGRHAHARGVDTEAAAGAALARDGWTVHARRLRTASGEIDLVAEKDGLLAIVEVKSRPALADAAALTARQRARLIAAAEIVLAEHPDWGTNGVRFDVIVVDATGAVRRIADAFGGDPGACPPTRLSL